MSEQKLYKVTVTTSGYVLAENQKEALHYRSSIHENEDQEVAVHEVHISENTQIDYGKKFSKVYNGWGGKTVQNIIDERTTKRAKQTRRP